ncbi:PAAR domain-containing protein [Proteus mirabilis]|nr:PAAR domain-containing protein [Proteus mirabilis]
MRSTIQGRKIILKNDTTNTKGTVLSGSLLAKQTHEIACLIPVALEGHKVQCGCLKGCVLVAIE